MDFSEAGLDFRSVAALCALISGGLAMIWAFVPWSRVREVLVVVVPLVVAYTLYWAPVRGAGRDLSEYSTWAPVFIAPWYLAGFAASATVHGLVSWLRRRTRVKAA